MRVHGRLVWIPVPLIAALCFMAFLLPAATPHEHGAAAMLKEEKADV